MVGKHEEEIFSEVLKLSVSNYTIVILIWFL
jgi:hypothetical protein